MTKLSRYFQGDKSVWAIYFFLCAISLVEVFSAASTLAYKDGNYWFPLIKQAIFLAVGTVTAIGFHSIPVRFYRVLPIILVLASAILLPFASIAGTSANGASRWIGFGFMQFQPSELAKGAVISATALILARTQTKDGTKPVAFKYILWIAIPICAFIFAENVSTALLLFAVTVAMMIIGRISFKQIGKLMGVFAIFAAIGFFTIWSLPENANSKIYDIPGMGRIPTVKARLTRHSGDQFPSNPDSVDIDKNAQPAHARIAIASCNVVGKMPGNSVERDFLSQAYSDFIFAIIIEELGLGGAVIVVFLYICLLFRAGRIANKCERNYPAFLAMGLALLLVAQAMLNMLVAVGLFPVTGQPLPLISRGGTSTIINSAYFGIILGISRYARQVAEDKKQKELLLAADDPNSEEVANVEGLD